MSRPAAGHARLEPSCGFAGRRAARWRAGGCGARSTSCPAEQIRFPTLERVTDEEFTLLSRASYNSPRGIWSDGAVIYVTDESDVAFGEFGGVRTEYAGVPADGVTETTVGPEAAQGRASVSIEPPDTDQSAAGHLVALGDVPEITVTVTSPDGSRERGYRVLIGQPEAAAPAPEEASATAPECLRGAGAAGFSLVVYEGGSSEDLGACVESRNVTALYTLDGGEYVSYILGAPEFVNAVPRRHPRRYAARRQEQLTHGYRCGQRKIS